MLQFCIADLVLEAGSSADSGFGRRRKIFPFALPQGASNLKAASVDCAEHICDLPRTCFDQAKKGIQRMPWYRKATKDVVSCDKPRVGANNL
jgi:hypothetical protein